MNPYIFLPTLALSTSSLENTLHLLTLMFACQGASSFCRCSPSPHSMIRTSICFTFDPRVSDTSVPIFCRLYTSCSAVTHHRTYLTIGLTTDVPFRPPQNNPSSAGIRGVFRCLDSGLDVSLWGSFLARANLGSSVSFCRGALHLNMLNVYNTGSPYLI